MAISDKTTIKGNFETGDFPTQSQFEDLIDTCGAAIQGIDGTYDIQPVLEGATAGNARGENSVDLCTERSNAAYVTAGVNSGAVAGENVGGTGTHTFYAAGNSNYNNTGNYCNISGSGNYDNSGDYCSISGEIAGPPWGLENSGSHCSISGKNNYTNSGDYCSISGKYNDTNSGYFCSISGAYNDTNTGYYCNISGQYAADNNFDYARVHGGSENARIIDLVAKCSTANTTPKAITLGGAPEGAFGSIIIPADTAWAFTVHVVAIDVTNGYANSKKFSFDGLCLNDGGTVTVSSAPLGTDATQGTFTGSVALSADTTFDALRIMATGIGTDTIRWTAQVNLTQVD
jgi:hypothetical protein